MFFFSQENDKEDNRENKRRRSRNFRRGGKAKQENGAESDAKEGDKKDDRQRKRQPRLRRNNRDLCIKVSNIARNVRIKELKTELRDIGFNPTFISWKGMCYEK